MCFLRFIYPLIAFFLIAFPAQAADQSQIPEPFKYDSPSSDLKIDYSDLDMLLKASVLYTGRSNREKASKSQASIGTRIKTRVNRLTANEANRFYFENFDSQPKKQIVTQIRNSLESLPSYAPLEEFNRTEQLAFWLNLYNVTLIDELLKRYPEQDLESLLGPQGSLLEEKLLNVAGIPLSLHDIQFSILLPKFDNNPLIMYGLYQGYIGGPNIRKKAFSGRHVFRDLKRNAGEFINSNRGTYWDDRKEVFRVSQLYLHNRVCFADFDKDLKKHLARFLSGSMRDQLQQVERFEANISDYDITDLYGSARDMSSSVASNSAAMLNAVVATGGGPGLSASASVNTGVFDELLTSRTRQYGRFTPEQAARLKALDDARLRDPGRVTVTDLNSGNEAEKEHKSSH